MAATSDDSGLGQIQNGCPQDKEQTGRRTTAVLATALVRSQNGTEISGTVRAMCDTGAQMNIITAACAKRLKLRLLQCTKSLIGIGGGAGDIRRKAITHIVPWFTTGVTVAAEIYVVDNLTGTFPSHEIDKSIIPCYGIMADPKFDQPAPIEMILGVEFWAKIMLPPFYKHDRGAIVQQSQFGYLVLGRFERKTESSVFNSVFVADVEDALRPLAQLNDTLRKFWEIEEIKEIHLHRTPEESAAEEIFLSTHKRDANGRYVVQMPIRKNGLPLGDSRKTALRRFFQLERRLERNPELREKYIAFMREYQRLGHMRMLPSGHAEKGPVYHIPHHAVEKKFRVVFDGSSKTTNGKSLNDIQMIGEKLQMDLADQLMRFRCNNIAIVADVKQMFRQIRMDESQWDLLRIFWRESPTDPLRIYQLLTVTYGMASAGHCAVRAMIQCARDQKELFPHAAMVVEKSMYMDDLLTGSHTVSEGKTLAFEIDQLLRNGGFELRHWGSNSQEIQDAVRGDSDEAVELGESEETKILGLRWLKLSDELTIFVRHNESPAPPTKRGILSEIARLYDPNGLVGPVIVSGKLLMQDVWRAKELDWDTAIPANMRDRWLALNSQLPRLAEFRVPRWIGTGPSRTIQLHGFCDASQNAYGAVLYVRVVSHDTGTIDTNILVSKSRVAPLKTITIPRLELSAAVLLAKLTRLTLGVCDLHAAECYMWSDSAIVLHWLRKSPSELKTFVANRIADIQTMSQANWWSHVTTSDNPADILSRGATPRELVGNKQWLKGPAWLTLPQRSWPKPMLKVDGTTSQEISKEEKSKKSVLTIYTSMSIGKELLINRYSSLDKIIRLTAYVFRFLGNTRAKINQGGRTSDSPKAVEETGIRNSWFIQAQRQVTTGLLAAEDRTAARNFWIMQAQRKAYKLEIESIIAGDDRYPPKSAIAGLRPIIDSDGLLRAAGRIGKANRSWEQDHPIILPPKTRITYLLLDKAHKATGHGGTQAMMAYIRFNFWIPSLRRECKVFRSHCIKCIRESKKTVQQIMGDLPSVRVQPARAFKFSGVDLAGPFNLRLSDKNTHKTRSKANDPELKGYVVVFVCMVTRAVHLDVVTALTSEKFLEAYERFASRRGVPEILYSDNGTNFVGASNILDKAIDTWPEDIAKIIMDTWRSSCVQEHVRNRGTSTWRFIPPGSPNQGGLWESAVKSMKYHLRRVAGTQKYTYEGLCTLLAGIEACMNSRPICAMSDDPEDITPLTPAHFLIGESLRLPIQAKTAAVPRSALAHFKGLQFLVQSFWQEWSGDYLSALMQRPKWKKEYENIRIGQLVLLQSENLPPTYWSMGRIIAVSPGSDGCVRSATVKVQGGTLERTVRKMCLLPVDDDLDHWI